MAVVLFGASDPEAQLAEELCQQLGVAYCYAVDAAGKRVHPGNAYAAQGVSNPELLQTVLEQGGRAILFECEVALEGVTADILRCDHHRPGDPGYGLPPEKFWEASSLGQLYKLLAMAGLLPDNRKKSGLYIVTSEEGDDYTELQTSSVFSPVLRWRAGNVYGETEIPVEHVLAAAADHCLAAAYRGQCPGVHPDQLMRWRAETRAAFQKRPVEEVLADVERARQILREAVAPRDMDGAVAPEGHGIYLEFADLRGRQIPELPEAAAREGIPFLADVTERDGRKKAVLQAAPPELVERFLSGELIPGLTGLYGDPARGFAGGYYA